MSHNIQAVIISCTIVMPAQPQGATDTNQARPYIQAKIALDKLKGMDSWDTPTVIDVETNLNGLKDLYSSMQDAANSLGMREFRVSANEFQKKYTYLSFEFAELAVKRKEFDTAESVYRGLISFFDGDTFGGIRDRAKIGLDDVKEARKTQVVQPPLQATTATISPLQVPVIPPPYDLKAELEKLNKMKKEKLITDSEYKALRKAAIEKSRTQ